MADTDEAAIHLPSHDSAAHIDTDLSDETQDFRMLSNLSLLVLLDPNSFVIELYHELTRRIASQIPRKLHSQSAVKRTSNRTQPSTKPIS